MATTTATLTLASSDLLTDNLSLSSTMSLLKGGTTATGLEQMNYHRAIIPTGTNFDLIEESDALKDNSNYVYIMNKNTDVTDYLVISINNEIIGKLYAGDWAFFPWACDLSAAANDSTIEIQAYTHEAIVEYALFHVGETLVTSADS
tara:strand:- start:579 stop:1019 length:441 start_codon:yes stop_codon:yes gene_type:complete